MDPHELIAQYYLPDSAAYRLLLDHSRRVADKALAIARRLAHLNPDEELIYQAAMLHDIGIFKTRAPSLGCHGEEPYIRHGILGRRILEQHSLPRHALVCERHVGVGISTADIESQGLPLPLRDMCPQTLEERIICYADLFFSKNSGSPGPRPLENILRSMERFGEDKVAIINTWAREFEGQLNLRPGSRRPVIGASKEHSP